MISYLYFATEMPLMAPFISLKNSPQSGNLVKNGGQRKQFHSENLQSSGKKQQKKLKTENLSNPI